MGLEEPQERELDKRDTLVRKTKKAISDKSGSEAAVLRNFMNLALLDSVEN